MESASLVKLERIARNLPLKNMKMIRAETDIAEVFMAYGTMPDGRYAGLYGTGLNGHDLGQIGEFPEGFTEQQVRQDLINQAYEYLLLAKPRGLLDA